MSNSLKHSLEISALRLEENRKVLDALNIFPVPDGDTGINVTMTISSAAKSLPETATYADLAKTIGKGSRGNSGVILGVFLKTFFENLPADPKKPDISRALKKADENAWASVQKPVEGTILSVTKALSTEAEILSTSDLKISDFADRLAKIAFEATDATTSQLSALKESNIVDAGALALAIFAKAFVNAVNDRDAPIDVSKYNNGNSPLKLAAKTAKLTGTTYEITANITRTHDILKVSNILRKLGSDLDISEQETAYFIHIHTTKPEKVFAYFLKLGAENGAFENLDAQTIKNREDRLTEPKKPYAVVAVADGDGLTKALSELGVDVFVKGGQSNNPSAGEIASAINILPHETAIFFTNNKNIRLAARIAKDFTNKPFYVIPTKNVAECLSALLKLPENADLESAIEAISPPYKNLRTAVVVKAGKDFAKTGSKTVKKGDYIWFKNGAALVAEKSLLSAFKESLSILLTINPAEFITVIIGKSVTQKEETSITTYLKETYPHHELEIFRGDQPIERIIISVE
ncbi:hypothetical protein FACS1894191_1620 [Clostridia bacterium]|nr:hypothetical protein FACS1894191_1620 [Clostridia bacterium]